MNKGMEIPKAVVVVVVIALVAVIGFFGRKVIMPPPRVQLSDQAIKGMKEHMAGQGSGGAPTSAPGMGSGQHSK